MIARCIFGEVTDVIRYKVDRRGQWVALVEVDAADDEGRRYWVSVKNVRVRP